MTEPKEWNLIKNWARMTYGLSNWQADPEKLNAYYRWWLSWHDDNDVMMSIDTMRSATAMKECLTRVLEAQDEVALLKAYARIGAVVMAAMKETADTDLEEALGE